MRSTGDAMENGNRQSANSNEDIEAGGTLRDILASLGQNGQGSSPPLLPPDPSWVLPPYSARPGHSSTSSLRGPPSPMPRTSSAQRPIQQNRTASASHVASLAAVDGPSQSSTFTTPARSIFSPGPPTSFVSNSSAQASIIPGLALSNPRPQVNLPSSSVHMTGSSSRRQSSRSELPPLAAMAMMPARSRRVVLPEKDVDDPSIAVADGESSQPTSTTLSRLFAASDSPHSSVSRHASHIRSPSGAMTRAFNDTASLAGHLLNRGLIDGRHSDIMIHAFGQTYRLHKLILERVPFFSSMFSGPWSESNSSEMTLDPEDVDSNITKTAFELALKRIYGTSLPNEEDDEAVGMFATACWLDMQDLVDSSVDSLLRQMHPSKLDVLIKLVTKNYYGKAGDRILSSAKAMLCREGWEMPYEYWDHIPAEIVREVIGGDPFYVPGEWERWFVTLKLLNRRLKAKALEAGLISASGRYLHPRPTSLKFFAVRFDTTYRRDSPYAGRQIAEKDDAWMALYTSPEIAPLLVLLDEGIHYVHLRFEQLQQLRTQKDILGTPILPEKVISNALWMSMELRQRVMNSSEPDLELGLSEEAPEVPDSDVEATNTDTSGKGKHNEIFHDAQESEDEMPSSSWDSNAQPRKFWIPTSDSSSVMGGGNEAYQAANSTGSAFTPTHHMSRLSASLEPSDVTWASDMTVSLPPERPRSSQMSFTPARYSHYPPFRFSAEFPNPRTLKEKKRVYSQTVWYAGSMWNLYIQRVNTSKNQQLGIYLHRAKEKDPCDDPLALYVPSSVDDRIGVLEREMLLRGERRRSRRSGTAHLISSQTAADGSAEAEDESDSGDHGGANTSTNTGGTVLASADQSLTDLPNSNNAASANTPQPRTPGMSSLLRSSTSRLNANAKTSQTQQSSTGPRHIPRRRASKPSHILSSDSENEDLASSSRLHSAQSAMPAYTDQRPTIKTYFKIYSPSKGGRMLSIYESAPDRFNFSQSWGWKSSWMVLDDGMDLMNGQGSGKPVAGAGMGKAEGKLRYMVVIGNV